MKPNKESFKEQLDRCNKNPTKETIKCNHCSKPVAFVKVDLGGRSTINPIGGIFSYIMNTREKLIECIECNDDRSFKHEKEEHNELINNLKSNLKFHTKETVLKLHGMKFKIITSIHDIEDLANKIGIDMKDSNGYTITFNKMSKVEAFSLLNKCNDLGIVKIVS